MKEILLPVRVIPPIINFLSQLFRSKIKKFEKECVLPMYT